MTGSPVPPSAGLRHPGRGNGAGSGVRRLLARPVICRRGTVIRLLSLAMLINALAAPGAMLAVAVGRARLAFLAASVNVAVNAVGSLVLVQHIGLRGALIGSLAGNVCATVLFLGLLRRAEPTQWSRASRLGRCCPGRH